MCDEHFEDDLTKYLRPELTRRQFGAAAVGIGMSMMLPRAADAVDVAESEVNVKTPDGTADCYFVHPSTGTGAAVLVWPDIFGLRPAFRQMGKRLAESGYAVLVVNPFYRVKKAPTADNGAATSIQQLLPLKCSQRDNPHDGRESVHRLARSAGLGRQEPASRDAGVLHGRSDGVSHRCRGA